VHEKYGKHTVFLGASKLAHQSAQHAGVRGHLSDRRRALLPGETARKASGAPDVSRRGSLRVLGLYAHFLLVQAVPCTKPRLHP
jgi:hypothetical protein